MSEKLQERDNGNTSQPAGFQGVEIFGQRFSYPTSWHGVAAVAVIGLTIGGVVYLTTKWASPKELQALTDSTKKTQATTAVSISKQAAVNQATNSAVQDLNKKIEELELHIRRLSFSSTKGSQSSGLSFTPIPESSPDWNLTNAPLKDPLNYLSPSPISIKELGSKVGEYNQFKDFSENPYLWTPPSMRMPQPEADGSQQ